MEFLAEGAVAIEVYGHKQANHRRNLALWDLGVIQAKTRSLRERSSDKSPLNAENRECLYYRRKKEISGETFIHVKNRADGVTSSLGLCDVGVGLSDS